MEKKKGRPSSYKTDDIKRIIDQYIRYTEGSSLISASSVAKFANEQSGLDNFRYYVIQRNAEAKQYLALINDRIKESSLSKSGTQVAVFKTIDIKAMLAMPARKLGKSLTNLNAILEDISDKQAKLFRENLQLSRQCTVLNIEIKKLQEELVATQEQAKADGKEKDLRIAQLKKTVSELGKVVRITWDEEAETILKKQGIFEDDGAAIDETKTIMSPAFNLRQTAVLNGNECAVTVDQSKNIRMDFLKGLKDI